MLNQSPALLIAKLVTLLVAFTFHEFAHAWMADRYGDDTPRLYGRLTLNPLSHLDPLGSLMLLFTGFGWAKPVPINSARIRQHSPTALLLVAISGPLSNFVLALLGSLPLRFGWVSNGPPAIDILPSPFEFLWVFVTLNLGLMIFNLIPLPPLDGEEILVYFLPPDWERTYESIRPYGPYLLFLLLFMGPLIGFSLIDSLLSPAVVGMRDFLLGGF